MKTDHAAALARALELLQQQDWQGAHVIVQEFEDDPIACRIHGLVHRIEGDPANARYWYGRAGARFDEKRSVDDEIDAVRRLLVE
jgi:hypothetical protein